jgi:hypothetical protein
MSLHLKKQPMQRKNRNSHELSRLVLGIAIDQATIDALIQQSKLLRKSANASREQS